MVLQRQTRNFSYFPPYQTGPTGGLTRASPTTPRSYPIEEIVQRALAAAEEGVCHLELASEARAADIGVGGVWFGAKREEVRKRDGGTHVFLGVS